MKGIPTEHKFRRYRSRLEARWAYLFDLLDWKYEYEPYDLNGWIPDFCIYGANELLVEVKPNSQLVEFETSKLIIAITGTEKEGKEILLLGSTIFESGEAFSAPAIGWLGEYYADADDKYWFGYAILNHNKAWGIFHEYGSYADRITGEHDGDHHIVQPSFSEILELWNEAGNRVQWKPPA